MTQTQNKQRLLSLDILRGLTVAGMILVDSGTGNSFLPLQHSVWNGMTPCDLVFPFFLFIMGISTYLSLKKFSFSWSGTLARKIIKRTVVLFLIGLGVNWFILLIKGIPFEWGQLRYMGILQRIALCYALTASLAICVRHRYFPLLIVILLSAYTALLLYGNGLACDTSNILRQADECIFGKSHLYLDEGPIDPEGLLSLIACTAHTMIGFCCCRMMELQKDVKSKVLVYLRIGAILTISGYLLTFAIPLNKRIWSPSYVCVTCGLAALLQGLIMYALDLQTGQTVWKTAFSDFFRVFGVNPLFLYVTRFLLTVFMVLTGLARPLHAALDAIIPSAPWSALAYAIIMVMAVYCIGVFLDKRHIYIKL